jgi:glycosyltransferase involved in cell wall biosynthesis
MPFKVAMVSTHPSSGGGVSSYTEKLIRSLRRHGVKVYLLSNKLGGELAKECDDIYACWNFDWRYPFQVFKGLCGCKPDVIHVQHEFFLYGGTLSALLFPLLLFLAKLRKKPVVVTLHGVIPLSEVNKRFLAVNEVRGPIWLLKIGLLFLTGLIVALSDAVIVHGNFFAETLRKEYGYYLEGKVYVISHGVDEVENKLDQNVAKEKLGLRNRTVILFFGYIAKYKGIETLIESFQLLANRHPDWVLIIGGGEHPRLKTRASYKRYTSELRERASSMGGRIRFTAFIREEDLAIYFSAADLVVFPYTVTMSSSGPFALAISYGKTVIASNIPPFKEVLPSEALFNKDDPQSLSERIEMILNHHFSKQDIATHIKKMRNANSWSRVGLQTRKLYQQILRRGK